MPNSPRRLVAALTTTVVALSLAASVTPAQAHPDPVDPAGLHRGADPRIAHLVNNTIHDGARSIRVRRASLHLDLWTTARGYVVTDQVDTATRRIRVTAVRKSGARKVIGRLTWIEGSAVSPRGTRMAWGDAQGEFGEPVVVTVVNPHTGEVKARRSFTRARVVAVSGHRVLLTKPGYRRVIKTWWWNYRTGTQRTISRKYAIRADIRHDRMVFSPNGESPARCHRVARLTRPGGTLWRSCRITPHTWSPNGERALSTNIYFDVPGTDRWVTVDGRTGARGARIHGRLDWDVAWESNRRFLTMAQGDDGKAAIIRCTRSGSCVRASRVWNLGIDEDLYYVTPPVLLSRN
jgi:hypothetical protein